MQQVDVYRSVGGAIQHDVVQYAYEHTGTGQLMDRTVNNGAPTHFHWSGFSPYLEDSNDSAYFYLCNEAGNVIAVADQTGALGGLDEWLVG